MRVFISWSGERSGTIGQGLTKFLRAMFNVDIFMSSDMEPGARWAQELSDRLNITNFGILCLTPEAQHSQWVAFEAGALSKAVEDGCVVPYLHGLAPADVCWPFAQFNAVAADEEGTFSLVRRVNKSLEEARLDEDILETRFRALYPKMQETIAGLPPSSSDEAQEGSREEELLKELLNLVRGITLHLVPALRQPPTTDEGSGCGTSDGGPTSIPRSELLERRILDRLLDGVPVETIAEELGTTRRHARDVYYQHRYLFGRERRSVASLPKSDRSIVRMLAIPMSTPQIAEAMKISEESVRVRQNKIARQLGLSSRIELAEQASELVKSLKPE